MCVSTLCSRSIDILNMLKDDQLTSSSRTSSFFTLEDFIAVSASFCPRGTSPESGKLHVVHHWFTSMYTTEWHVSMEKRHDNNVGDHRTADSAASCAVSRRGPRIGYHSTSIGIIKWLPSPYTCERLQFGPRAPAVPCFQRPHASLW